MEALINSAYPSPLTFPIPPSICWGRLFRGRGIGV